MGLVKAWMMEEAEKERRQELRQWFIEKHGRPPRQGELGQALDEYEMDEAIAHAMDKDD